MIRKTTLQLSKEEVISKLENLSFNFKESYWEEFQQAHVTVKHSPTDSHTKVSARLIAIPAVVLIAGMIVYFSVNNLQSQNHTTGNTEVVSKKAPSVQPSSQPLVSETVKPAPVVKTESKPSANIVSKPVSNITRTDEQKPALNVVVETAPEAKAKTVSTAPAVEDKKTPVVNMTSDKSVNELPRVNKRSKKDKKLTTPVLMPSPEEDDIIVPEN